jgi:hypothetical protein
LEARLTAANYFEGLWERLTTEDFRALTPLFHLRDPRILLDIWQMQFPSYSRGRSTIPAPHWGASKVPNCFKLFRLELSRSMAVKSSSGVILLTPAHPEPKRKSGDHLPNQL